MTRRTFPVLALCVALSACETTDAGRGAGISYRMPHTDAAVTLALTLADCTPDKVTLGEADLGVAAVEGARPELWTLEGSALSSVRLKRSLTINTSDNGVLTGVNSTTTDRTPAIVGNVVKTAATLAPLLMTLTESGHLPRASLCGQQVQDALARASLLNTEIGKARWQLSHESDFAKGQALRKTINAYAVELAGLKTGILRVESGAALGLTDKPQNAAPPVFADTPLVLDPGPFEKWFGPGDHASQIAGLFGLKATAEIVSDAKGLSSVAADPAKLRACGLKMWVPTSIAVNITVTGTGRAFGGAIGKLEKSQRLPVSQWSDPADLCLDAGFGEDRTVNLSFDRFGRTTSLTWSSEASGETISGAVAGMAPDIASIAGTLHPTTVAQQKAEIEALQTQQQVNQLRACKAILDAGGYDCTAVGK